MGAAARLEDGSRVLEQGLGGALAPPAASIGACRAQCALGRSRGLARYEGCSICIKVCPVQRYGLEDVLDHYNATGGKILGKGTEELEGYTLHDKGLFWRWQSA